MSKNIEVTDSTHIELATSQYINHLLASGRVVMVQDAGPVIQSDGHTPTPAGSFFGNASTLDRNGRAINTFRLVPDAG